MSGEALRRKRGQVMAVSGSTTRGKSKLAKQTTLPQKSTKSAAALLSSGQVSAASTPQLTPKTPASQTQSIPIAAPNSETASQVNHQAGARLGSKAPGGLPANYKSTARKVTGAIVAMPVLIVTSYVLYQRFVLGEERKHLDRQRVAVADDDSLARSASGNGNPKTS